MHTPTGTTPVEPAPVELAPEAPPWLPRPWPTTVDEALSGVVGWPSLLPGTGATARLWGLLASLAAADLAVARAVEPHLDATAILAQTGQVQLAAASGTWGVFAAEGHGVRLDAGQGADGAWRLSGVKPWCSLADRLDAALVTAHLPGDAPRGLFAVGLRGDGVEVLDQPWAARGLTEIPSTPVRFDDVPAVPVGGPGWYLDRPGFWWGGIGVAACWFGGAVGIARRLYVQARSRQDDQLTAMHLGAVDERLQAARCVLAHAAAAVDAAGGQDAQGGGRTASRGEDGALRHGTARQPAQAVDGRLLAKRVRATVARTCEEVLAAAGHALGPAPLALEADHAKRVADLQVYLRQHHAERDDASLGAALAQRDAAPW